MSNQVNNTLDEKLVEVIVPVFNVANFLPKCIDSILEQTYQTLRIWLVDDGSTDGCSDICDDYAQDDCRIVVIHKDNGGQSSARNRALDEIFRLKHSERGKYVTFVDSDDWVEPDFIGFLVGMKNSSGAQVVQCGHWISYSNRREVEKDSSRSRAFLARRQAMESVLRNGHWDITVWNKLFDIELFRDLRFSEGVYYEDTAIAPLIVVHAESFAFDMAPKYHYVQRYTSTANGNGWTDRKLDFIDVGDEVARRALEVYPDLIDAALEKRIFVRLSTLAQMVNTGHYDLLRIREMRSFIMANSWSFLRDPMASSRDKAGVIAIAVGFWFFRLIWRVSYLIRRRR